MHLPQRPPAAVAWIIQPPALGRPPGMRPARLGGWLDFGAWVHLGREAALDILALGSR